MEERRTLGLQWQLVAVTAAAGLLASGLAVFGVWVALQQGFGWNEALVAGVAAGVAGGLVAAGMELPAGQGHQASAVERRGPRRTHPPGRSLGPAAGE